MATSKSIPIETLVADREVDQPDVETILTSLYELDQKKLPINLSKEDFDKVRRLRREAKSLEILVTGKTGVGKSTMTNGILGVNVEDRGAAKEGRDITKPCTTKLQTYQTKIGKINLTVYDSPGLQDGTENQEEYLQQMKKKCFKRDLTFYCIKMAETRFVCGDDNPDVIAMRKLTQEFGNEFWKTTIIVLTFANTLEAFNVEWEDLTQDERNAAFWAVIKQWGAQIKKILIEDIKVPQQIVETIQIVPAGHYRRPHLPGYRYWLSKLWFHCVDTITSPEVRMALVTINERRIKREKDVKEDDFKKLPELQPIVLTDETISKLKYSGKIATGAAVGAGIGGALGLLGAFGGPLVAATITAGVAFGGACGAAIAAMLLD